MSLADTIRQALQDLDPDRAEHLAGLAEQVEAGTGGNVADEDEATRKARLEAQIRALKDGEG